MTLRPDPQRGQMTQEQQAFFTATVMAAIASQRKTKVPASITIAQAILESGWGKSLLAREANNYFGIKDTDHQSYKEFPTTEFINHKKEIVQARFECYPSVADCFTAHARLLSSLKRYQPAMAVCNDAAKFALALQECGYSTAEDPKTHERTYARMLMQLVRQYDLTQYDVMPPEPPAAERAVA